MAGVALDEAKLSELSRLFGIAEAQIKEVERYVEDLVIPAVNELRYFGFHFLKGLTSSDPTEHAKQLDKAKGHCQRAIYDASEAGVIHCLGEIKAFQEDYATVDVIPVLADWVDILGRARDAQEFIGSADHDNRDGIADECRKQFGELVLLVRRLEVARSELNKNLSKQRRENRRLRIVAAAAVLGAAAAIGTCSTNVARIPGAPTQGHVEDTTSQEKASSPVGPP